MTPFAADGSGGFSSLPEAVSAAEIRLTTSSAMVTERSGMDCCEIGRVTSR